VEISMVIVVLALFAAMIMPNLAQQKESRERLQFRMELRRLIVSARERAITRASTQVVTYEDATGRFQAASADENGMPGEPFASATLPDGVTADQFRMGDRDVGDSEWEIRFHSDGSSEGAGLQLGDGQIPYSVTVDLDGTTRAFADELPQAGTRRWEAGSYEQRM
jgi:type II secretory pathway pseudopilin PulG